MRNFKMTLAASGTLKMDANIQYLCMLFHQEVLIQFDLLFAEVENIKTLNVDYYINSLALYFSLVDFLSKKNHLMCRGMKKHAV